MKNGCWRGKKKEKKGKEAQQRLCLCCHLEFVTLLCPALNLTQHFTPILCETYFNIVSVGNTYKSF